MNMGSFNRALLANWKAISVVLVIGILIWLFLLLRGKAHKKLNKRLTSASNQDGDETRWLKTRWGLFISPIIGFYRDEIVADLSTISAFFLGQGHYNFILPAPWYLAALNFRFWLVKSLDPIARPWLRQKWKREPFLRLGRTIEGKSVNVAQESLILLLGIPDSGKSKLAYTLLEQLAAKKNKSQLIVIDITMSFPKRVCERAKAKRIITITEFLDFARELAAENQRRQRLLDRFDIDHVRHLPSEHKIESLWIFIDEAHILFSKDQDFKSEKGKQIKQAADLLNEIIITGRKTQISIVYLSQSALKSETLINIGRSKTIITGYLPPSESDAIGLQGLAVNPGLKRGVFLVRSADTGPEPVILRAWHRNDQELNKPLDSLENRPS